MFLILDRLESTEYFSQPSPNAGERLGHPANPRNVRLISDSTRVGHGTWRVFPEWNSLPGRTLVLVTSRYLTPNGSVEWSWAQSRDAARVRRSGGAGEERLDYPLCACRLRRYKMANARNDDKG